MPRSPEPQATEIVFTLPVRIYYEDTDAGGVVYHSNYINFMERARTEYLRELGVEQDALAAEHGIIFAVRAVDIQFLAPARYNDLLQVSVSRPIGGGASVRFSQTIVRGDTTLATANIRIVSLDPNTLRPRRIPAFLLTECRIEQ